MRFWTGAFFVALFIFLFIQTVVLAHPGEEITLLESQEQQSISLFDFSVHSSPSFGFDRAIKVNPYKANKSFLSKRNIASPASSQCPLVEDPELSPIHYQLLAAFESGKEGYALPCSFRCNSSSNIHGSSQGINHSASESDSRQSQCQAQCQNQAGLKLLKEKILELSEKNLGSSSAYQSCPSYVQTCLNQCAGLQGSCREACSSH